MLKLLQTRFGNMSAKIEREAEVKGTASSKLAVITSVLEVRSELAISFFKHQFTDMQMSGRRMCTRTQLKMTVEFESI